MAELLVPSWNMLNDLVNSAEERVLICSPFYTKGGINHLFDNFGTAETFQFWTRMNPSDWAHGATDPEALIILIDILLDDGRDVELKMSPRLHAKAYIADNDLAYVGSSNLSDGGFDANMEILVQFRDREARRVINEIETNLSPRLKDAPIDGFREWVQENKRLIKRLQRTDPFSDRLKDVQKSWDEMLGFGKRKTTRNFDSADIMEVFVNWLRNNRNLSGADKLISRITNADRQNLTGHFRQSFFGAYGFFLTYPRFRRITARELQNLEPAEIYQPTEDIQAQWIKYLEDNATLSGEYFNYSVLRGILPPGMGGTVIGGGGGISTIKRMLPLVARFMLDGEHE